MEKSVSNLENAEVIQETKVPKKNKIANFYNSHKAGWSLWWHKVQGRMFWILVFILFGIYLGFTFSEKMYKTKLDEAIKLGGLMHLTELQQKNDKGELVTIRKAIPYRIQVKDTNS